MKDEASAAALVKAMNRPAATTGPSPAQNSGSSGGVPGLELQVLLAPCCFPINQVSNLLVAFLQVRREDGSRASFGTPNLTAQSGVRNASNLPLLVLPAVVF